MKREILFKAQRADGEGWVEGNYCSRVNGYEITEHCIQVVIKNDEGRIISISTYEVLPETVCQYTGLDEPWINGKQVFQSDKLYNKDCKETCVVVWMETKGAWGVEYADGEQHYLFASLGNLNEVTGNIHDKLDWSDVENEGLDKPLTKWNDK